MSDKQHATLRMALRHPLNNSLVGRVYGHPQIEDGRLVETSAIVKESGDKLTVETLNTVYTVEWLSYVEG